MPFSFRLLDSARIIGMSTCNPHRSRSSTSAITDRTVYVPAGNCVVPPDGCFWFRVNSTVYEPPSQSGRSSGNPSARARCSFSTRRISIAVLGTLFMRSAPFSRRHTPAGFNGAGLPANRLQTDGASWRGHVGTWHHVGTPGSASVRTYGQYTARRITEQNRRSRIPPSALPILI